MTPQQRRLWYLERYEEFGAAHVLSLSWRLTGPVDEAALADALQVITERHELLRATCSPDDSPHLLEGPAIAPALHVESPGSPEAAAARCAELADRPMPLHEGPLFTAHLLREDTRTALLLLRVHHLIADGWSLDVLTRELGTLYTPGAAADPCALDPLPLTAAEAAAALRAATDAYYGDESEAEAYWRESLRGTPEALDLPYDHARPSRPARHGDRTRLELLAAVPEALHTVAAEQGGTFFTSLYAVLTGFLCRLADTEDVVAGVPVANRSGPEFEGLVGFHVDTLPIRMNLSGDPNLGELVARTRDSFFEGCVHRGLPFDGIVRAAAPPRVPGRTPLFQVLCVLQNTLEGELNLAGVDTEPYRVDHRAAAFDLTLEFWQRPDGRLGVMVEYATELFTPEHGRLLAERFAAFATAWAAEPSARLGTVPLLLPAEGTRLLDLPAGERAHVPGDALSDILARLTAQPDRTVVRCAGTALTAGRLLGRVAELAGQLTAAGIAAGDRVGVRLPRGTDTIAALLAILSLDAVYVPVDGRLPEKRQRLIEEQAGLRALLTDRGVLRPSVRQDPRPAPGSRAADPDAYVFFTSGSSGLPKGVLVGRRALTNFLRDTARRVGLRADDVVVASTATTFDISLLELLSPLACGGVLEVADDRTAEDPTLLAALVDGARATVVQATPSVWQLLLDHLRSRPRIALTGGEALGEDLKDRLLATVDEVYNLYGPTETTVWSAIARCGPGPVTVGTALANTELYVVDSRLRPLPPGRTPHRRRRTGPRISRPGRAHRRRLRGAGPRSRHSAAVPHGRHRMLGRGRAAAAARPQGRTDQAARPPNRTG
ncbi:hypothetical protein M878_44745 [Streptomyces roseochromogenus subsp. oscitans DS 12.976]|uniref:Condensation domain-containing protein n=2 Tax=Streptomyces roseochromogenus TaxID=285450 RepID=V6JNM3_STRRC|nr:hypothetical protein M878_44745 [Streptomyces roseochromogenus subsp. oscitans DS 12.976]